MYKRIKAYWLLLLLTAISICARLTAQVNPIDSLEKSWIQHKNPETLIYLVKAYLVRDIKKFRETNKKLMEYADSEKDTIEKAYYYIAIGRYILYAENQKVIAEDYFNKALILLQNNNSESSEAARSWIKAILSSAQTSLVYAEKRSQSFDSSMFINFSNSISLQSNDFFKAETLMDYWSSRIWWHGYQVSGALNEIDYYSLAFLHYKKSNCIDGMVEVAFQNATAQFYDCKNSLPFSTSCRLFDSSYKVAYNMAQKAENKYVLARVINHFAYDELEKNNVNNALHLVKQAETLCKGSLSAENYIRLLFTYKDIYTAVSDFKKALYYTEQISILKDSLEIANNIEQLAYVSNNYENQTRDLRIHELNQQNEQKKYEIIQSKIYLIGITIFLLSIVISLLLYLRQRRKTTRQLEKNAQLDAILKSNLQNQLMAVQIQALQSQMNPHFIFNALNSIQNLILEEDKSKAMQYLNDFAQLSRLTLENSDKEHIKLKEEINFLKRYLELESLRRNYSFEYSIEVEENIDMDFETVPPMLIQPFVENAIKHGLTSKSTKGELKVVFKLIQVESVEILNCIIDDNGIGRKMAAENKEKQHNSVSSQQSQLRVELLSRVSELKKKYHIEIIDKYNNDETAAGTMVSILLPFGSLSGLPDMKKIKINI